MSWSDEGRHVALQTASCTHLLVYHPEAFTEEMITGSDIEASFEIVGEIPGNTRIGLWYKEAYLTVNNSKLLVHIGSHVRFIREFDC